MKKIIMEFMLILSLPFILVLRGAGLIYDLLYMGVRWRKAREALSELRYLKKVSIDEAQAAISGKYKWRADRPVIFDYPRLPVVTVMRRGGDCEDFTRLYCELVGDNRRFVSFSVIYGFMKGHTMGIYYSMGKFHICSNLLMFSLAGDSFEDAIKEASSLIDPKYWFVVVGSNRFLIPLRLVF